MKRHSFCLILHLRDTSAKRSDTDVVFGGICLVKARLFLVLRCESLVSLCVSLWISGVVGGLLTAFVWFLVFGCWGGLFRSVEIVDF